MIMTIGPSFPAELQAAGLLGLPFSWGEDGVFGIDNLTVNQQNALKNVLATHNPAAAAPLSAEQVRTNTFKGLPERQALLDQIRTATPAQIDTWLTNNVTTLAQARTVLGQLIKLLAISIRE